MAWHVTCVHLDTLVMLFTSRIARVRVILNTRTVSVWKVHQELNIAAEWLALLLFMWEILG
jgi:hypothetical protein